MAKTKKKRSTKFTSPLTAFANDSSSDTDEDDVAWKRRRIQQTKKDLKEEERLTDMIFGSAPKSAAAWYDEDDELDATATTSLQQPPQLFEIDRVGVRPTTDTDKEEEEKDEDEKDKDEMPLYDNYEPVQSDDDDEQNKGAWKDEDDANVTVDLNGKKASTRIRKLRTKMTEETFDGQDYTNRLRQRYSNTATVNTDWAKPPVVVEDDSYSKSVSNLLSSTKSFLSKTKLPPNKIDIARCQDLNLESPHKSCITSVQFLKTNSDSIALTAGLDKSLKFYKIDQEEHKSKKIHGMHFPHLPIYSASFLGNTENVVVSGRRKFFYIYNSVKGKIDKVPGILGREERSLEKLKTSSDGSMIAFMGNDGYILLVDVLTKRSICNLKMNGSVRALSFSLDNQFIRSSGSDGDVYKWDLRTRQCVEKFSNQDGTITQSLAQTSKWLAVGAESGVVNFYNNNDKQEQRTPIKSIMNLQTSIDDLQFNHDGQILAITSRREKGGLKLVHTPTQSIFSNWPIKNKTPLNYVWSMDFCPQSKYMIVGNDKGKCSLYTLRHYSKK